MSNQATIPDPRLAREPADPTPDPRRRPGMLGPQQMLALAADRELRHRSERRAIVGAGIFGALGILGCAPDGQRTGMTLPKGAWAEPPNFPANAADSAQAASDAAVPPATPPAAGPSAPKVVDGASESPPVTTANRELALKPVADAALPWAKPRFLWAKGQPIYPQLNPMLPITCVTIHHDGLEELCWATKQDAVAERLELYRRGHLGRGWADIGYHLAIDRGGSLWQCRSIRWQGAHVHLHNEGNIGVLVMGNFELQKPSTAQLATLRRVVTDLCSTYQIRRGEVYTHKEWRDAQTACPGSELQPRVESMRKSMGV